MSRHRSEILYADTVIRKHTIVIPRTARRSNSCFSNAGTFFVPITAALAAFQVITQLAQQPSYPGPLSIPDIERSLPDLVQSYQRNCRHQPQQQHWSDQASFSSKSDSHRCHESRDNRQAPDFTPMSHEPNKTRPSSKSLRDGRPSGAPTIQSRPLPPIQPNEGAAAQDVPQRAQSAHNVSMRPTPPPSSTPPEQRLSRPIGVENLLNPTAGDNIMPGGRRHNRESTDSPRTVPMAAMSRPATPSVPPSSMRKHSSGDITLPSITPPLMNSYPQPIARSMTPRSPTSYGPAPITTKLPTATIDAQQSPFVLLQDQTSVLMGGRPPLPSEMATGSNMLSAAYKSSAPPPPASPRLRRISQSGPSPPTYPRMQALLDRPGNMAVLAHPTSRCSSPTLHQPRNSSPPALHQVGSTGQPRSFFSAPFASTGPASTIPQLAFDKKAFDTPASGPSGQSQYQMMTLETEQGPIQVPVDVQAASKVADEKRKRNATASHRFRQRRKEKEQETSNNIAKLEAQVREITEEKEHYQRERDFLQDVVLRNRIPIPPRPASPRRRRHASLGGPPYQDLDPAARNEGRNTRRRTSAYVPPQGPPQHTVEPPPPIPPFERMSAMPPEHIQGLQQRLRPPGTFHPNASAFDPSTPR
ncbi:MAG: hypothetical protein Q9217_001980 [Psora testacea]